MKGRSNSMYGEGQADQPVSPPPDALLCGCRMAFVLFCLVVPIQMHFPCAPSCWHLLWLRRMASPMAGSHPFLPRDRSRGTLDRVLLLLLFFISNRIPSLAICLFLSRGQRPRIISWHLRCKEDLRVPEVQSSGPEAAGRGQSRGGCPGVVRGRVAPPQAIRMCSGCWPEKGRWQRLGAKYPNPRVPIQGVLW